mmetsp:Transcript_68669/g.217188  ORF Transcript_68669/g.217188 Transcript_68669/m.217188 type:complete len:265 (-) Transcript_68669:167-961(-)
MTRPDPSGGGRARDAHLSMETAPPPEGPSPRLSSHFSKTSSPLAAPLTIWDTVPAHHAKLSTPVPTPTDTSTPSSTTSAGRMGATPSAPTQTAGVTTPPTPSSAAPQLMHDTASSAAKPPDAYPRRSLGCASPRTRSLGRIVGHPLGTTHPPGVISPAATPTVTFSSRWALGKSRAPAGRPWLSPVSRPPAAGSSSRNPRSSGHALTTPPSARLYRLPAPTGVPAAITECASMDSVSATSHGQARTAAFSHVSGETPWQCQMAW